MSTNIPPDPNINIFNNSYWSQSNESITKEYADKHYLKYPIAQGDEITKNLTVNGIATVNSSGSNNLILNSNATLSQYSPQVQAGDQVLCASGLINSETLTLTTQSTGNTRLKIKNDNIVLGADNYISLVASTEVILNSSNINLDGPVYNRGVFNSMNTSNNNILSFNTNPTLAQYNPCVTTNSQVIAATGITDSENLILTSQSSTNNGIIINNLNCDFTSTNAPTSNQTLLASNDNSTKIPTTQWVQSAISSTQSVYSVLYTTDQTIVTPSNCRSIDIFLQGAGGESGSLVPGPPTYYGGSGGGGNTISCYNIPMSSGENLILTLTLTSTTGSTTLTRNSIILARAFNGNSGTNGSSGLDAFGATQNTTPGVGDTSFGCFYNTFGDVGMPSSSGGTVLPNMSGVSSGCPKGTSTWANNKYGCGQRSKLTGQNQGQGYALITYHIGS